jgi:hypothetical protein
MFFQQRRNCVSFRFGLIDRRPGCILNGYIYLGGVRNVINRATMNRSKDHIDGVGNFPGGVFFFNMTKP